MLPVELWGLTILVMAVLLGVVLVIVLVLLTDRTAKAAAGRVNVRNIKRECKLHAN